MTAENMNKIIEKQRAFFATGKTLEVSYRIDALKRLKKAIIDNEEAISNALREDLGKSEPEGYFCETGLALSEVSYMIKHTRSFARDKRAKTPLTQFVSKSIIKSSPYGNVLVMSPWNYPFLLSIDPLADAIAAGNTVVLKPSAYSPKTSEIIAKIIKEAFDEEYVAVITGGRAENSHLLSCKFDYIFFTGSKEVGKYVMSEAAKNLTPVTLELGGKSPLIVDETAKIDLSARRIVFAKYLNCGQTCVAPDYVLCQRSVKDKLVQALKKEIVRQFGENPVENINYGKIVNEKHFDRILALLDDAKCVHGGRSDRNTLKIEPTVLDNVTFEDAVMKEEIFGPVLPILTYESLDEVISIVNGGEKPLALYVYSENKRNINKILSTCQFGGGCINDGVVHLATSEMGFGGVGESGMGAYHGKVGFDTFSHKKSILDKKTFLDMPMRYQPYKKSYVAMIKMLLK